ncbi:hypothetical protein [Planctobacterium marinum]|uniref:DUF4440 domain-containing protein n=1 Tax=Planctobacterium marinum TaxID=1631968 RepID=A0AA48HIZ9_9ALTE|nr:hypothetical protein MACH26_16800 [Planctobacterium marinum]
MRFTSLLFSLVLSAQCFSQASAAAQFPTPESALVALWNGMSHEPGKASDIESLSALFHPEAKIFGVSSAKGKPELLASDKSEFISLLSEANEQGFFECEIARKVDVYDRFASAYSVVESRFMQSEIAPQFTGVNSIQLFKGNDGWQIISLCYQVEVDDLPISAPNGKTGQCLN